MRPKKKRGGKKKRRPARKSPPLSTKPKKRAAAKRKKRAAAAPAPPPPPPPEPEPEIERIDRDLPVFRHYVGGIHYCRGKSEEFGVAIYTQEPDADYSEVLLDIFEQVGEATQDRCSEPRDQYGYAIDVVDFDEVPTDRSGQPRMDEIIES